MRFEIAEILGFTMANLLHKAR